MVGTAAYAYGIHASFDKTLKCNKVQEDNRIVMLLTFVGSITFYLFVGIFGSFCFVGKQAYVKNPSTFIDYFDPNTVSPFIVEILYFLQVLSIFPIYFNSLKSKVYEYFPVSDKLDKLNNIICMLIFAALKMNPKITVDSLISLDGAVCCFVIVYLIPILLHLSCHFGILKFNKKDEK